MSQMHSIPRRRAWGPLTAELRSTRSPVTLFLQTRFPNRAAVQREYREQVGSIVVPDAVAAAATLGTAFDWLVRFELHSQPSLRLAILGARTVGNWLDPALEELAAALGADMSQETFGVSQFEGPAGGSQADEDTLLRGCWALALLTELCRSRAPGSPLLDLGFEVSGADLLNLATPDGLDVLRQLRQIARNVLTPVFVSRSGLWALGPTFSGSRWMNADADLIVGGLLLENKTALGDKKKDGTRSATLDASVLNQILGYVLLDFDDEFEIREVALFAARYSHLAVWDLQSLLDELAGHAVNLVAERAAFRALLTRQHDVDDRQQN